MVGQPVKCRSAASLKKNMHQETRQAVGKGQPSLGSGCPSTAAVGSALGKKRNNMPLMLEQKHPADLVARRVMCIARNLAASAVAVAAVIVTPAASVAAIIAVAVVPVVARGDVNHRRRAIPHRRWAVGHGRRAVNDGWRAISHRWRTVNHGRRILDRDTNGYANRPTCLGGSGESRNSNHSNQTEQMFCFHARFDGLLASFFTRRKMMNMTIGEAVREEVSWNE